MKYVVLGRNTDVITIHGIKTIFSDDKDSLNNDLPTLYCMLEDGFKVEVIGSHVVAEVLDLFVNDKTTGDVVSLTEPMISNYPDCSIVCTNADGDTIWDY